MNTIKIMTLGGATFLLLASAATAASNDMLKPVTVTPIMVTASDTPAMAPMALNSMSNPPDRIATARVVDDKGITIGAVQKVDIQGGKPSDVKIALLGSQQIVALDAGKLSYDESNNVLTSAMDKSEIVQMPAADPRG